MKLRILCVNKRAESVNADTVCSFGRSFVRLIGCSSVIKHVKICYTFLNRSIWRSLWIAGHLICFVSFRSLVSMKLTIDKFTSIILSSKKQNVHQMECTISEGLNGWLDNVSPHLNHSNYCNNSLIRSHATHIQFIFSN